MERSSGILMHISSLPNKYGIGTFGKSAYDFVDFLYESSQKYWQILPLNPTGYGNSPYSSFSSFAGNYLFIDIDILIEEGMLSKEDLEGLDFGQNKEKVDYEKVISTKNMLLKKAYENKYNKITDEIEKFRKTNKEWIDDFALFMALKNQFDYVAWNKWDDDIKSRNKKAVEFYKKELKDEINFWVFTQYLFFQQWNELKIYANNLDIKIIGDIPIYVAEDSVDTWVHSDIFHLDNDLIPISVAGCPPDGFSDTGQLWGNPIYRWDVLEKRKFDWWISRIKSCYKMYDIIRIDHFKGIECYWSIPYGSETAATGEWVKGPREKLFNAIRKQVGKIDIIAEDLGYVTEETIQLRDKFCFPGMKILLFAFYSKDSKDAFLPHNYRSNFISYTGTHDNETVMGWIKSTDEEIVEYALEYLGINKNDTKEYHWGFIRAVWSSVADLAIVPMQDFLGLDNSARMNIPSTVGGNWEWRAKKEVFTEELSQKIKKLTNIYGR